MSDGYVKLFQSILNSSLMHLDSDTFKVFIVLLAMADHDGIVRASILAISDRSKVDLRTTERAMNTFMEPDQYSTNPQNEGRRVARVSEGWHILNHAAYRERKPRSQKLADERLARHRAKKKAEQAESEAELRSAAAPELQRSATLCNALKRPETKSAALTRSLTADTEADTEADREEEADAENEGSDSAFSASAQISASADAAFRRALWARLTAVVLYKAGEQPEGRDPPHYRAWWQNVSKRVVDSGGIGELVEWVSYCEDCRDPAKRRAKDLGVLPAPARWMASRAKKFLDSKGLKLPKAPENAALVGK